MKIKSIIIIFNNALKKKEGNNNWVFPHLLMHPTQQSQLVSQSAQQGMQLVQGSCLRTQEPCCVSSGFPQTLY